MSISRFRPTPAFVVAMVALLVGLSGTAVAAGLVPNSVKSKHIANGQVKKQDIAASAVRGEKVLDGSLTGADVQDGSVASADIQDNSVGSADVQDTSLASADVADNSLTGVDIQEDTLGLMSNQVRFVSNTTANVPNGVGTTVSVDCPANEKAIGGGAAWVLPGTDTPTALEAPITASMPTPGTTGINVATGWTAAGRNLTTVDRQLRAYAICVPR